VHAEGKNIGICGELGAEMKLIETYAKMGMDELSVSSSGILEVREKVSEIE
jgi:phosphotransferase system enzyme I (PtsI)